MTYWIYDERAKEWRTFSVVPPDPTFRAACGGMFGELHQFAPSSKTCACQKISRQTAA